MPEEKDPRSPATTSLAWDGMIDQWSKIDTVLAGTDAMRAAGDRFLPVHHEEDEDTYSERLFTNVLYNMSELTLDMWTGKPFSELLERSESMPDQVQEWMEDVDLQGNALDVFARNWFREGLAKAFAHILVEFPRINEGTEERPRTLADDREEGVRPYWVFVKPENVIFAERKFVDGHEVLTHVRIHEVHIERDGFAEVATERIRVYDAGGQLLGDGTTTKTTVTIYEKIEKKRNDQKDEWRQIDQWELGIEFIPMVTFYADREDFMLGKPPIQDVVDLNIRHWQSNSDQIMALTVARFPILAASGAVDDDDNLKVGPRSWLHMTDAVGRYYYVETNGNSLGAGEKDLEKYEERMSVYALDLLKKKRNPTATGRVIDEKEATSPLQDMAVRFQDALNLALEMTAAWVALETAGTVEVNTEFGVDPHTPEELRTLRELRTMRDISRARLLTRMQQVGVLDREFDFEANERELEDEAAQFDGGSDIDLDVPGGDVPPVEEEEEEEVAA